MQKLMKYEKLDFPMTNTPKAQILQKWISKTPNPPSCHSLPRFTALLTSLSHKQCTVLVNNAVTFMEIRNLERLIIITKSLFCKIY